jgi:hypothetical protein
MSVQSHQSQHHNRRRPPNVDVHVVNHHSDSSLSPDNTRSIGVGRGERHGGGAILRHRPCPRTAICRRPHPRHARGRTGDAVMTYKVEITKVYFVQAEFEGEAVQIALEMLESGKSVM